MFVTAVFNVNVAEVVGWHSKVAKKSLLRIPEVKTANNGDSTWDYSILLWWARAYLSLHPVYTLCLCSGAWVRISARRNCRSHGSRHTPPVFCFCLTCRTCWILLIRRQKGFRGEERSFSHMPLSCHATSMALPNEGRSPKTKDNMYLICLVFWFLARCPPREDKDGVVSQNDFMIFMKDAGGKWILHCPQIKRSNR